MRRAPATQKILRGGAHPAGSLTRAGFTLIELMVVVSIIAIVATVATPSIMGVIADRRTQKEAVGVLSILQEARGRSFGKGGAVIATWSSVGAVRTLHIQESGADVNADGTVDVPSTSCAGTLSPSLRFYNLNATGRSVVATAVTNAHSTQNAVALPLELCFTPQGRMLDRTSGTWQPSAQLFSFRFETANENGPVPGLAPRWIHIAPNGVAKMNL